MEQLITLIIITFPGLLTYILAQLVGENTFRSKNQQEALILNLFLWIPIVIIILAIYELGAAISHIDFIHPKEDWLFLKKNWLHFNEMSDLMTLANNPFFLLYYFLMSFILSYFIATRYYGKIYSKLHEKINQIRGDKGKVKLSIEPTVWGSAFLNNDVQVVRIGNVEGQEGVIGELAKISGDLDDRKDILLREVDHWTNIMKKYEVEIREAFIDTNTGIRIEFYDPEKCLQAQKAYYEELEASS